MSDLAQLVRHTFLALFALCCLAGTARAQPAGSNAEPFRVVWSSSASCGDAPAFASELTTRTALLRDAERGEHAIVFIVETFLKEGGVRGQLTMHRPNGELSVREVPGASCEEVESAMALIAALMVDPLAAGAPARRHAAVAPSPLPERSVAASAPAPEWSLRVEHRLLAQSAVAPRLTWGQAGRVMLTQETGTWRPSLALGAHFTHATTLASQGSAELDWSAAQLSLCPVGVRPRARWDLRACAAFQLGRLRGAGFQTPYRASKSILWSAAGAQLEGRVELLGPLWLGLEGALTFPFTRERFYIEPGETLHRVPALAANFGLGVGLYFF